MSIRKHNLALSLAVVFALIGGFGFQKTSLDPQVVRDLDFSVPHFQDANGPQVRYAPGQVIVKFKPSVSGLMKQSFFRAYRFRLVSRLAALESYLVEVSESSTVEGMVLALNQNPYVEYAEPNRLLRINVTPNDTQFKYQYALYNSGQQIGSVPGSPQGKSSADIKAPPAWEETEGRSAITIAVVDTGVDMLHPDLDSKIKSSGRDFVNNDFDATDDHGHGTMIAGIAAAETNNNEGIAGVTWNCKVLPVKVADESGLAYEDDVADGIRWAVDNGADVINLSLGSPEPTLLIRDAMKYAHDKNVVVVVAAGNTAGPVEYPAAYNAYCLAVSATDYNDLRTLWSSYGPEIDVAAPGDRILSTYPVNLSGPYIPYAYGSGTSFSAPHVAGLAALIKSIKPGLKVEEIRKIIRYSADDVNASQFKGRDDYIGYGRINMEKALVPIKVTQ